MIQRATLKVEYYPDVDILTLWNGTPASNGSDIAEGVMVFMDEDDEPQIITIEGASKLLKPFLSQLPASVFNGLTPSKEGVKQPGSQ